MQAFALKETMKNPFLKNKPSERMQWQAKFFDVLLPLHKSHTVGAVQKLMASIEAAAGSIRMRSKKAGVTAQFELSDLRQLVLDAYGKQCKYCDRIIHRHFLVFDHRQPLALGGSSDAANLQVICKTCNGVKGSLCESDFLLLQDWLKGIPSSSLAANLTRRLCGVKF
jgi:hypothetical protein